LGPVRGDLWGLREKNSSIIQWMMQFFSENGVWSKNGMKKGTQNIILTINRIVAHSLCEEGSKSGGS
jgi:hypothetical protein